MKRTSQIRSFLSGIFIFVLGVGIIAYKDIHAVQGDSSSFASEPVQIQGFELSEEVIRVPVRIIIPRVQIDLEVQKASVVNGYWEVFEDKAGWGEGSGIPGESGNQVVFAHARDGLFVQLKDVSLGEKIYVLTNSESNSHNEWYGYSIVEIREVYPNETEVIAPTDDETLTLYTCSGYNDEKRLIVVAKRF